jgi:hypothetical protein
MFYNDSAQTNTNRSEKARNESYGIIVKWHLVLCGARPAGGGGEGIHHFIAKSNVEGEIYIGCPRRKPHAS